MVFEDNFYADIWLSFNIKLLNLAKDRVGRVLPWNVLYVFELRAVEHMFFVLTPVIVNTQCCVSFGCPYSVQHVCTLLSRESVVTDETCDNISPKANGNSCHLFWLGCCLGSHLPGRVCAGDSRWDRIGSGGPY